MFRQYDLHKAHYYEVRVRFGLPAQTAARCLAKVADAYKLDKKVKRAFQPLGGLAFDDRNLTWHTANDSISVTSLAGRLKIAFAAGAHQLRLLASRTSEADLTWGLKHTRSGSAR